jgi:UDP-glucose 4-epimerase
MSNVYGFEYTIFRPHNIYGPGQSMSDPWRNVVAAFMRCLKEGVPYKLFGQGKMRRAFSYVEDVTDVMIEAIDPKFNGVTMNVGSQHDITIKSLSDMLQEITGISVGVDMYPARPQENYLFVADHTNQDNMTIYHETPLKEGLKTTWEWVKDLDMPDIITKEKEIYVSPKS